MNRTTNDNKTGKKYLNLKAKMKNPSKSAGNNWVFTAPAGLGWCGKKEGGDIGEARGTERGQGATGSQNVINAPPEGVPAKQSTLNADQLTRCHGRLPALSPRTLSSSLTP